MNEFAHPLADVLEVVRLILAQDSVCYWTVSALSAAAFGLMCIMLPVRSLALVLVPLVWFGGLCGIYVLERSGVSFGGDRFSNVVLSATVGMVLALIVGVFAAGAMFSLLSVRAPVRRAD